MKLTKEARQWFIRRCEKFNLGFLTVEKETVNEIRTPELEERSPKRDARIKKVINKIELSEVIYERNKRIRDFIEFEFSRYEWFFPNNLYLEGYYFGLTDW